MVRMVAIAALGLCACWVVGDEGPQPFRGWSHVRQDDCDGDDVATSAGDYVPLARYCSSQSDANRIAVCWDQADFANPAMAQPWCTVQRLDASAAMHGRRTSRIPLRLQPATVITMKRALQGRSRMAWWRNITPAAIVLLGSGCSGDPLRVPPSGPLGGSHEVIRFRPADGSLVTVTQTGSLEILATGFSSCK